VEAWTPAFHGVEYRHGVLDNYLGLHGIGMAATTAVVCQMTRQVSAGCMYDARPIVVV